MKLILAAAITTTVLVFANLHAQAPTGLKPVEMASKVVNVTPDEAEKLIADGLLVVDLRTEDEYEAERIKGAKNVNALSPEFPQNIAALDHSKPILVHCASGKRSLNALNGALAKEKFPTIYHLQTGIGGWIKAKKPTEKTKTPIESGKLPDRLK